jgi:hypothetical protein
MTEKIIIMRSKNFEIVRRLFASQLPCSCTSSYDEIKSISKQDFNEIVSFSKNSNYRVNIDLERPFD